MRHLAARAVGSGARWAGAVCRRPAASAERTAPFQNDRILVGLASVAALVTAWYLLDWGSVAAQVIVFRLFQPLSNLLMCVLSVRTARLAGVPDAARRFWYSMSICGLILTVGNGTQAWLTLRNPVLDAASIGTVQSVCQMVGTAFPLAAMLFHPLGLRGRRKRLAFWIDAATVMVATVVFVWYFLVGKALGTEHFLASIFGSALLPVAVFAVVKLLLSGSAPFNRPAALVGAGSAALEAIAGALNPVLLHTSHAPLLIALSLFPAYLFTATPRVQELRLRVDPGALGRSARPYSRLPYLAVAMTHGLLAVALIGHHLDGRIWGVVVGSMLITGMVVARQLAAFADNSRLLSRLDESLLEVRRHEERFRSLVQHATEIILITGPDGIIGYASPAMARVLGIDPEAAVGHRWDEHVHPDDLPELEAAVGMMLQSAGSSVMCQIRARHLDGSWRWLETISTNLLDDASVGGVICNARDISESREFQDRLRHEASHDPLTRLANRALFGERIDDNQRQQVAVLLIDLDDFKAVNDTLGHHIGDALLVEVAERLRAKTRPVDVAARLGGDEFAVLLPGASEADAEQVAERIMAAFAEPVIVEGHELRIRASVGLAVGVLDEHAELLREADAAMYSAKRSGKDTISRWVQSSA